MMRRSPKHRAASQGWRAVGRAFLLLALLLPAAAWAQGGGWQWGRRLGGSLSFAASGQYDEAARPATDGAGNIYLTGGCDSPATFGGSAYTLPYGGGGLDVLLARYDSLGRFRWARGAGGPGTERGTAVAVGAGGNVLLAGYSISGFSFVGAMGSLTLPMSRGGFLASYDSAGTLQ